MHCSSWIGKFQACIFTICSFVIFAQSDVPRPRGVSLSKASLYSPTKDFTCFDGTMSIPFSYVNDDYCDCFDGSDEPGTAACLNGVFHCTNAGHRPQNLPSSRVNDGICDCCDGTDEYASQVTCSNTCEELGQEARAKATRLAELHKAGSQIRTVLIEKGNKLRSQMAEQLSQLENDKGEAEKFKAEREALKDELEIKENEVLKVYREAEEQERLKKAAEENEEMVKEATEHFTRFDSNSDGELSVDEIRVVNVFDKNKDGELDEEEIKYFFVEAESVSKQTFIETTWPMLKPLLMMDQGMFRPGTDEEPEADANAEGDADDLARDIEQEDDTEDDLGDVDLPQEEEEHELEPDNTRTYDEETQRIVDEASDARRQLTDAERTVREIEANIRNIKQNLEKDYGLQQEYATLEGECLEYEDKEYVYKLCLFQKVTQKSKNGGHEVGLGNWGDWAGGELNRYSMMKYTNGVACWNGPSRSTTVKLECGLATKIGSVSEPFRCEYLMTLTTPAACDDSTAQQHSSHDEL